MPSVKVQTVSDQEKPAVPIFEEFGKRLDEIRRRAYELFEKRGSEIGRALEDWFKAEREVVGSPPAEFADKGGAYELQIALPGFDVKDVNVTAAGDEIIVKAASREEKKSEEGKVLWTEFSSNDLYRRFQAPNLIDTDKTTATLEKGMLHIHAPKAEVKEKASPASAAR